MGELFEGTVADHQRDFEQAVAQSTPFANVVSGLCRKSHLKVLQMNQIATFESTGGKRKRVRPFAPGYRVSRPTR
jgi:hypothetical protein